LMKIDRVSVIALNRVLEKKGRRQQFFDSWKPRFFVLKDGVIEHWREQKVRLSRAMLFLWFWPLRECGSSVTL
jgi:hypothetical protein